MRLDYLTIFPDYFAPLGLSLPGKAAAAGLVRFAVHDLREWTTDRHRTVDDTPFGGGAGMVLRPEPFGAALDELAAPDAVIVVPTPAGPRFSQALARELAQSPALIFLCGRYEGIDQRVLDDAATRHRVVKVSLGDYVLNGGEVAALAITEAIVRLLPGFMGNPESLVEESHEDGLLEAPVYTKPAQWRGHQVPEVLRSGNHAAIAAWRQAQARERTVQRRPDLLAHAPTDTGLRIESATRADADSILLLQRACWVQELLLNPQLTAAEMPALSEPLDMVHDWMQSHAVVVARSGNRVVAAARAILLADGDTWEVSRVMVDPTLQGSGLGRRMVAAIEALAPEAAERFQLFVAPGSDRNQRIYRKAGYRFAEPTGDVPVRGALVMRKRRRR